MSKGVAFELLLKHPFSMPQSIPDGDSQWNYMLYEDWAMRMNHITLTAFDSIKCT
jgi:hypothetical protein